jgi:hypothetical protein
MDIKNPFKDPDLARAFDAMIRSAKEGGLTVVDSRGVLRRRGGGTHRCAFWNGYEYETTKDMKLYERGTMGWACYRAGMAWRKAGRNAPEFLENGSFGGYTR